MEKRSQNLVVYIITLPPETIEMWIFLLSWKTFGCNRRRVKEMLMIPIHFREALITQR